MFKKKYIICTTLFLAFLIITSFTKNKSRLLEKQITKLHMKILSKEKDINETELDFYYLSSPVKIEKKLSIMNFKNYTPIEHSKIFLTLSDFTSNQIKFSTLDNLNEKKTQKKQ